MYASNMSDEYHPEVKHETIATIVEKLVEQNKFSFEEDNSHPLEVNAVVEEPFTNNHLKSGIAGSQYESRKISFVTSNVGHPMLVVDMYTFHKHSTNQKTGRINWRCSKRRVKGGFNKIL